MDSEDLNHPWNLMLVFFPFGWWLFTITMHVFPCVPKLIALELSSHSWWWLCTFLHDNTTIFPAQSKKKLVRNGPSTNQHHSSLASKWKEGQRWIRVHKWRPFQLKTRHFWISDFNVVCSHFCKDRNVGVCYRQGDSREFIRKGEMDKGICKEAERAFLKSFSVKLYEACQPFNFFLNVMYSTQSGLE